jgi:hypothetical protein
MARSYKKTPVVSYNSSESEKQDKRFANRRLRRSVNLKLAQVETIDFDEDLMFPEVREVSDIWNFDKDGKHYFSIEVASVGVLEENDWRVKAMRK